MKYDFLAIEPKWQEYWDSNKTFHVFDDDRNRNSMCLICSHIRPEPDCMLATRKDTLQPIFCAAIGA